MKTKTVKKSAKKIVSKKRVSRKNSHVKLEKGYILPHGYEVKSVVVKKKKKQSK